MAALTWDLRALFCLALLLEGKSIIMLLFLNTNSHKEGKAKKTLEILGEAEIEFPCEPSGVPFFPQRTTSLVIIHVVLNRAWIILLDSVCPHIYDVLLPTIYQKSGDFRWSSQHQRTVRGLRPGLEVLVLS